MKITSIQVEVGLSPAKLDWEAHDLPPTAKVIHLPDTVVAVFDTHAIIYSSAAHLRARPTKKGLTLWTANNVTEVQL